MLTWMQHNKKYLVITIWISTIAFVGAGFLGWGAYDYNLNRSLNVALVGDEKISYNEFNTRYNQIFHYYNEISNGGLTEDSARQLGLETLALNSLIDDKLLLNFAKDLGLNSNDDEVIQALAKTQVFQDSSGDFNKTMYYELLGINNITPKEYEKNLSNQIIIGKLEQIFELPHSDEDFKMLGSSYFMQDSLSIAKLNQDQRDMQIDEEELKILWNEYKEDYKTERVYELSTYFLPLNTDGLDDLHLRAYYDDGDNRFKYRDFSGRIMSFEAARDDVAKDYALRELKNLADAKFLELRDGRDNFQKDVNITDLDVYYPLDLLSRAKSADILRPSQYQDGYIIIRLNKINPIRIKSFEEAREELIPLYLSQRAKKQLEQRAKEKLGDFSGINIGFVNRDSTRDANKIKDDILNDAEFSYFLMNVFNSDQNSSYVIFNEDKAILYRINKQKLHMNPEQFDQYHTILNQNLQILKGNELRQEIMQELKKTYPIKIYYKGGQS